MAYLKKDQRYNEILKLAIKIAMTDGISTITTRRIAAEGNIAIGQIHHHFQSISHLKALVLQNISDEQLSQIQEEHSNTPIPEQLINLICPIQTEKEAAMRRLWSETTFIAERDNVIKQALKESIEKWHQEIFRLINTGNQQKIFEIPNPHETSWQLIALSCGLDSIATIDAFRLEDNIIKNFIYQILQINKP